MRRAIDADAPSTPTVSVVIPTYNYGRYVASAIASLQNQTLTDWECIVVDDGSTDDTRAIIAKLASDDPRIRWLAQPRQGPSAARNAGLAAARAPFVQFLDADDMLLPGKLAGHVAILHAEPETDLVYCACRYFVGSDTAAVAYTAAGPDVPWTPPVSGSGRPVIEALLKDNVMVMAAPMIRQRALAAIGGFNPAIRHGEDWEAWLRLAVGGARFRYDESTDGQVLIRVHGRSASRDEIAMLRGALEVRRLIDPVLATPEFRRLNARRAAITMGGLGLVLGREHRVGSSTIMLMRATVAGRDPRWLGWALVLPTLRFAPGRWLYERAKRLKRGRRTTRSSLT